MLIKLASTWDREAMSVRKVAGRFSPNVIRNQTAIVIPIRKSTILSTEPCRLIKDLELLQHLN